MKSYRIEDYGKTDYSHSNESYSLEKSKDNSKFAKYLISGITGAALLAAGFLLRDCSGINFGQYAKPSAKPAVYSSPAAKPTKAPVLAPSATPNASASPLPSASPYVDSSAQKYEITLVCPDAKLKAKYGLSDTMSVTIDDLVSDLFPKLQGTSISEGRYFEFSNGYKVFQLGNSQAQKISLNSEIYTDSETGKVYFRPELETLFGVSLEADKGKYVALKNKLGNLSNLPGSSDTLLENNLRVVLNQDAASEELKTYLVVAESAGNLIPYLVTAREAPTVKKVHGDLLIGCESVSSSSGYSGGSSPGPLPPTPPSDSEGFRRDGDNYTPGHEGNTADSTLPDITDVVHP